MPGTLHRVNSKALPHPPKETNTCSVDRVGAAVDRRSRFATPTQSEGVGRGGGGMVLTNVHSTMQKHPRHLVYMISSPTNICFPRLKIPAEDETTSSLYQRNSSPRTLKKKTKDWRRCSRSVGLNRFCG